MGRRDGHLRSRLRPPVLTTAALLALGLVASSCAAPSRMTPPTHGERVPAVLRHPWHDIRHHVGDRFRNLHRNRGPLPIVRISAWTVGQALRRKEQTPAPTADRPDARVALAERPARVRATWLGHASVYLQTPDLDVLLDPVFSRRVGPFASVGPARETGLPIGLEDLPSVDVVVLSHDHYDHADARSVRDLAGRFDPLFIVPLGMGHYVRDWTGDRARVAELDWWEYVELSSAGLPDYRLHATPAEHNSGRQATNRDRTLWAGWFLEGEGGRRGAARVSVFYGGDTGYGPHFSDVRAHLGAPDVTVLPIGAYRPAWFLNYVHLDPGEAVQAFVDLEAGHLLPVHWGTFDLAEEPLDEPPRLARHAAAALGVGDRLHVVPVGASLEF